MRIGIIGGGSAGLTAAWLLQDDHEVTIIERQNRLGGHAHTVEAKHEDATTLVDSGFEFFIEDVYPGFSRLLDALKVPRRSFPMTLTLYFEDSGAVHMVPPKRPDGFFWPAFAPRSLSYLLQFAYFLRSGARMVESPHRSMTIGDFVAHCRLSRRFRDEFLYPFMIGGWCIPIEEFRRMSAYCVLKYIELHRPRGLAPRIFSEIPGGTAAYVAALRNALSRVFVQTGAEVRRIRRTGGGFAVEHAGGGQLEFDHLVFATNAAEASSLLERVEGAEAVRAVLGQFRYFQTWIAVHGDRRLMPRDTGQWSVFNIRWCKYRSMSTVWKQQRTALPVFKSWVDRDAPPPEPLYHFTRYHHPFVDAPHFEAQQRLAALQGRQNLWFAGAYTDDIDCHENAVQSAIRLVRQLAPASRNLARLV